jgi:hypothetical protein
VEGLFVVSAFYCLIAVKAAFTDEASVVWSSQKWSKGKMKEKTNNQVLFDQVRRMFSETQWE